MKRTLTRAAVTFLATIASVFGVTALTTSPAAAANFHNTHCWQVKHLGYAELFPVCANLGYRLQDDGTGLRVEGINWTSTHCERLYQPAFRDISVHGIGSNGYDAGTVRPPDANCGETTPGFTDLEVKIDANSASVEVIQTTHIRNTNDPVLRWVFCINSIGTNC